MNNTNNIWILSWTLGTDKRKDIYSRNHNNTQLFLSHVTVCCILHIHSTNTILTALPHQQLFRVCCEENMCRGGCSYGNYLSCYSKDIELIYHFLSHCSSISSSFPSFSLYLSLSLLHTHTHSLFLFIHPIVDNILFLLFALCRAWNFLSLLHVCMIQ